MMPVEEDIEPALAFLRDLWTLDHALGSASKRMHDRMGITGQQRMVLRFVGKHPGITAGTLATILHVERSTLSAALKRLEDGGFVVRRADQTDGRKTFISLTPRGRCLDIPTVGTVEGAVSRTLRTLESKDVALVRSFLRELARNLEE